MPDLQTSNPEGGPDVQSMRNHHELYEHIICTQGSYGLSIGSIGSHWAFRVLCQSSLLSYLGELTRRMKPLDDL